jgi:hypothetical protein
MALAKIAFFLAKAIPVIHFPILKLKLVAIPIVSPKLEAIQFANGFFICCIMFCYHQRIHLLNNFKILFNEKMYNTDLQIRTIGPTGNQCPGNKIENE